MSPKHEPLTETQVQRDERIMRGLWNFIGSVVAQASTPEAQQNVSGTEAAIQATEPPRFTDPFLAEHFGTRQ